MRLSCTATDIWIATSTQSSGEFAADIEFDIGIAHQQRLSVGVHRNEFDASETGVDHAVDCIDATAANTNHLDHCEIVLR